MALRIAQWLSLLLSAANGQSDLVELCKSGYRSFSGFAEVRQGGLFYWYFEPAAAATDAPLILWLQGGPGATSMLGNFFELGPFTLRPDGSLQPRAANETWASLAPVIFVDSPVGTGWSWAAENSYAKSQEEVAAGLRELLEVFVARHPHVAHRRLVLAGESYGGHFIPALGASFLEKPGPLPLHAVAIGDGLTDPATQVLTKPQQAFAFGLVDEKQLAQAQALAQEAHDLALAQRYADAADKRSAMEDLVKSVSHINPYDVRLTTSYTWQEERMQKFFNLNSTKDWLHIPRQLSFGTAPEVKESLKADIMKSQKPHVESLLQGGVPVLLYQGQFDWKDGVVSNAAWIRNLSWTGTDEFLATPRHIWRVDGAVAGYWRKFHNLEQVVVLGAGHMVPMNQPWSARDMIARFLNLSHVSQPALVV